MKSALVLASSAVATAQYTLSASSNSEEVFDSFVSYSIEFSSFPDFAGTHPHLTARIRWDEGPLVLYIHDDMRRACPVFAHNTRSPQGEAAIHNLVCLDFAANGPLRG
ncbi:hypothetical protein QBC46DRAFT_389253 [Diplogelasinospora grovesii]|uniref:Uncharacterized protein n=1 Tax=Diplogelasinospora grovesii TaxID=303347 RepID=A0AAN6N5T0_9PEZI|nr:hypothetical protein QBC46DRAFT_389253 [Diplogelasinospora grovesii]